MYIIVSIYVCVCVFTFGCASLHLYIDLCVCVCMCARVYVCFNASSLRSLMHSTIEIPIIASL